MIRVPNAELYDYGTLVNFHSALLSSILRRHRNALKNLDITIWALIVPIAKAISKLHALRELSITIQECSQERGSRRKFRAEQAAAWDILCTTAASRGRLSILHLENGELTHRQLSRLLVNSPRCQELTLLKCGAIGTLLWGFLGDEWQGRSNLRALTVAHCGGTLGQATLDSIGRLKGLQALDVLGCTGLNAQTMLDCNRDIWHIPHFIAPRSYTLFEQDALEVDSDYEDSDKE